MPPDTILLLGATGFAGRHFRLGAEAAGLEVVGAARWPGDADVACDLGDPKSLEKAIEASRPDAIVNLAGAASVGRSFEEPERTFETNAIGPLRLLEAARAQAPSALVLLVSSGEVYGALPEDQLPAREEAPLAPLNPYGASKAAMEMAASYAAATGLRVCVIRAFNHIGPGQSDAFVTSSFARQVAEAERAGADEVRLATGNLSPARDFTDVRDIARAYVLAVERGLTGTYNACSGKPIPVRELIDHIQSATSLPVRVETDPARLRPAEVPVLYGSAERLRAETGWAPEIPIERTLADLLDWWRERLS